jgi:bifunctional DNase/RNase
MIQLRVASLGVDPSSQSPVVILQESGGSRVLPIWIGPAEASAIAMELAGMKFARPLTHDLLVSVIRSLGATLERVEISRLEENTYFAQLWIQRGEESISLDARPSDSIAVALRTGSGIWTDPALLSGTPAVTVEETQGEPGASSPRPGGEKPALTPEQLREYLSKLDPQDLGRFQP